METFSQVQGRHKPPATDPYQKLGLFGVRLTINHKFYDGEDGKDGFSVFFLSLVFAIINFSNSK